MKRMTVKEISVKKSLACCKHGSLAAASVKVCQKYVTLCIVF